MSNGTAANDSGKLLERLTEVVLVWHGIDFVKPRSPIAYGLGSGGIVPDFKLMNVPDFGTVYVECRRQRSAGSAKDKMYKLLMNIKQHYDTPTIVIMDGEELSVQYDEFRTSIDTRLVGVFWFSEFVAFAEQWSTGKGVRELLCDRYDSRQKTFLEIGA